MPLDLSNLGAPKAVGAKSTPTEEEIVPIEAVVVKSLNLSGLGAPAVKKKEDGQSEEVVDISSLNIDDIVKKNKDLRYSELGKLNPETKIQKAQEAIARGENPRNVALNNSLKYKESANGYVLDLSKEDYDLMSNVTKEATDKSKSEILLETNTRIEKEKARFDKLDVPTKTKEYAAYKSNMEKLIGLKQSYAPEVKTDEDVLSATNDLYDLFEEQKKIYADPTSGAKAARGLGGMGGSPAGIFGAIKAFNADVMSPYDNEFTSEIKKRQQQKGVSRAARIFGIDYKTPELDEAQYNSDLMYNSQRAVERSKDMIDQVNKGFFEQTGTSLAEHFTDYSKTLQDAFSAEAVNKVTDKLQKINSGELQAESLTPQEKIFIHSAQNANDVYNNFSNKIPTKIKVASGIGGSVGFMLEMAATAGVGVGAGLAAKTTVQGSKYLAEGLGKAVLGNAAELLTSAGARAFVMPSTVKNVAMRHANGEDLPSSIVNGYVDTYVSVATESLGGTKLSGLGTENVVTKALSKMDSAFGNITDIKSAGKALIDEIVEEKIEGSVNGARANGGAGVYEYLSNVDNTLVEALTVSAIGGTASVANVVGNAKSKIVHSALGKELGALKDGINDIIDSDQSVRGTIQSVNDLLKSHIVENDLSPIEADKLIKTAHKYTALTNQQNVTKKQPAEDKGTLSSGEFTETTPIDQEVTESGEVIVKPYRIVTDTKGQELINYSTGTIKALSDISSGRAVSEERANKASEELNTSLSDIKDKKNQSLVNDYIKLLGNDVSEDAELTWIESSVTPKAIAGNKTKMWDVKTPTGTKRVQEIANDKTNKVTYTLFDGSNNKIGVYTDQNLMMADIKSDKMPKQTKAVKTLYRSQAVSSIVNKISEGIRAYNGSNLSKASLMKDVKGELDLLASRGVISKRQHSTALSKLKSPTMSNTQKRNAYLRYLDKVLSDETNIRKQAQITNSQSALARVAKSKSVSANVKSLAGKLSKIDPSLIEDIDGFKDIVKSLLASSRPSGVSAGKYKAREVSSLSKAYELVNNLEAKMKGINESDALEMKSVAVELSDESLDKIEEEGKEAKKDIIKQLESQYDLLKLYLTDATDEADDFNKGIIKDAMTLKISDMSLKDAVKYIDSLNKLVVNGDMSGLGNITEKYKGVSDAKKFLDTNIRGKAYRTGIWSWTDSVGIPYSKVFGDFIASNPSAFENIFRGITHSSVFTKLSGFDDFTNGNAKAGKVANSLAESYNSEFKQAKPNGEDFNSPNNKTERGMFAFVRRVTGRNAADPESEFLRRKGLVESSIKNLMDGSKENQEIGKLQQEAYDKILKDSNSVEEVIDKVAKENELAVEWWGDKWEMILPELATTTNSMYNINIDPDINYNTDSYRGLRKVKYTDPDGIEDGSTYINSAFNGHPNMIIKTKDHVKVDGGMYINMDFDTVANSNMSDALVDIYTSKARVKLKSFLNSKDFDKSFDDETAASIVKNAISNTVASTRGRLGHDRSEMSGFANAINKLSNVAATRLLTQIFMPIKQFVPPTINTMIMMKMDVSKMVWEYFSNPAVKDFIEKSGRGVAIRGKDAAMYVDALSKQIDKSSKSGVVNGLNELTQTMLEYSLSKPDELAAQFAWITYYKDKLIRDMKKNGAYIDSNIDWSTHKLNEDAADYAQKMVDRQQNVSDQHLRGMLFKSKDPMLGITRRLFFSMSSFMLNQKARMYADLAVLTSRQSSLEDKGMARRSLASGVVETAAFTAISTALSYYLKEGVLSMLGDDDDKERASKELDKALSYGAQNISTDVLSPVPVVDKMLLSAYNKIQKSINGDDAHKFEIFQRTDPYEQFSVYSTMYTKTKELADMLQAADGDVMVNKKEVSLTGKQKGIVQTAAMLQFLHLAGAPSEFSTIAKTMYKSVKEGEGDKPYKKIGF